MAQYKNSTGIKANKLFAGIYDIKFNFKDKNFFEVKEGDVIYSRGDKSEYMYLVVNGRIKFKTYENPRQPKVFLVSKNEFFGEQELIDTEVRNSSAVAEKDSLLFKLSHKEFVNLSSSNRKIINNLSEKKYEEVVAPTRKTELKQDLFQRFLEEPEIVIKKEKGIELKDNSYENPLLEMKARDEITDELKMYEEDETDKDDSASETFIDDDGIQWDFKDDDQVENEAEDLSMDESESESIEEEIILPEPQSDNDVEKVDEQVNIFTENIYDIGNNGKDLHHLEPEEEKKPTYDSVPYFFSAVKKINSGSGKEETDNLIIEACIDLVNAEKGILYYPDENDLLKGKFTEEETELFAAAETIPGRCFRESVTINISDVFNDPNFNPEIDYISYFHIHSLVCIPVSNGNKVKAVIQLFNSRNGEFSDIDLQMLENISPVILNSIERWELIRKNGVSEDSRISEISEEQIKKETRELKHEKEISLKVLSDFLMQEFQVIVGDMKQFNAYLQKLDIPAETKEVSDIVTNQSKKIIDLLEALKLYAEPKKSVSLEEQSYVSVFDEIVNLLAEYTEGRKVNLYKRFESDIRLKLDSKFLYLSVFQLIKYQCDLMPFGGNIFVSSVLSDSSVEINIRNATRKTDETLVISPPMEFNENTPSGIGLSLAKRIIEDHDAVLEIKNQSGTGLEIVIRFPSLL